MEWIRRAREHSKQRTQLQPSHSPRPYTTGALSDRKIKDLDEFVLDDAMLVYVDLFFVLHDLWWMLWTCGGRLVLCFGCYGLALYVLAI